MKSFIRLTFVILSVFFLLSGCNPDKNIDTDSDVDVSAVTNKQSSAVETITSNELKAKIIGQWGRLDEVMHYFTEDGRCVIGGMQGAYNIDDENNLVLTTMSGSVTTYDWASSRGQTKAEHYWYIDGDTMKIDGNEFTKIYGKETPDYIE